MRPEIETVFPLATPMDENVPVADPVPRVTESPETTPANTAEDVVRVAVVFPS